MAAIATNPFQNLFKVYSGSPQEVTQNVITTGLSNPITPAAGGVFTKLTPPVVGLIAGAGLASLFGGQKQEQSASTTTDATQTTQPTTITNPDQKQLLDFLGQQRQTTTTTTSTTGDTITIPGSGNYVYGGGVMPSIYTTPTQTQQPTQQQPINVIVPTMPTQGATADTTQAAEATSDNSGLILIALAAAAAFIFGRSKK